MYKGCVTWKDFNSLAENLWRQRVTFEVDEKGIATMGFRQATLDMLNLEDPLVETARIVNKHVLKSVCILWKTIKTFLGGGLSINSFVLSERDFNGITWLTVEWHEGQVGERILLVGKDSVDFVVLKWVCEQNLFPHVEFSQTERGVKVSFSQTVMRAIGIGEEEVNRACLTLMVGACLESGTNAFTEVNKFGEVCFPRACEIPNRVDGEFLGKSGDTRLDVNFAGFWVLNELAGGGRELWYYDKGDGRTQSGNHLKIEKMDEALRWCCGGELKRSGEFEEKRGKNGEVEKVEKTEWKVNVTGVKAEMMRKWDEKFGVRL